VNAWLDLPGEPVTFQYTNHRGTTEKRKVIPLKIWYGSSPWHPDLCWLLRAVDLKKGAIRDFKLLDIAKWSERTA
jgi:predicted DNA-binding transcriptional regulator YafY